MLLLLLVWDCEAGRELGTEIACWFLYYDRYFIIYN